MHYLRRFWVMGWLFLAWVVAAETAQEMLDIPIEEKRPSQNEQQIGRVVVERLERSHYASKNVTPALCSEWYEAYFDALDNQHRYFLQSDLEEFRSYEVRLWNPAMRSVNLEFAYKVYARYLKRLHDSYVYLLQCLEQKQSFTEKEMILLERKDEPRPLNLDEQKKLLRQLVKNQLLELTLEEMGEMDEDEEDDEDEANPKEKKTHSERLEQIKKQYARVYKNKVQAESMEILEIYLNALCRLYDPHTDYLAPFTKEQFDMHMSLSLQGIGATLNSVDGYVNIVELVPGGPADLDGRLKSGDKIVAVAQEEKESVDTVEMSLNKVVSMIRGPKGTKVHLTVQSKGQKSTKEVVLVRDIIQLKDEEAKSSFYDVTLSNDRKGQILVMHLPSFYCDFKGMSERKPDYKSTTRDMLTLLKKAEQEKKLDGVIIDLRSNGGGSLVEAISMTGLFIPSGPVVQLRYANGKIENSYDPDPQIHYKGPVIIMVDRFSASASEIMAAALQDCGRALIVGEQTSHGKGTMQVSYDVNRLARTNPLFPAPKEEMGSLKMTYGKFYRINGGATQLKGVVPDIILPSLTDVMDVHSEASLKHALPWDEISSMRYTHYSWIRSVLPEVREKSAKRIAESSVFKEYRRMIDIYGEFSKIKEVPLELEARRQYNNRQKEASKIVRDFFKNNLNTYKETKGTSKKKETPPKDLFLEETLNIMRDVILILER